MSLMTERESCLTGNLTGVVTSTARGLYTTTSNYNKETHNTCMYIVPFTIIIRTVQFSSTKKYSLALNYCMAPLKNALNACTLRQLQYQSKTSSYSNVSTGVKVTPLLKRLLPLVTNYSDMQRDSLSQQPLTLDTH